MIEHSSELPEAWAQRERLSRIARILYWRGWVQRRDLTSFYGISSQQASSDLVAFQTIFPKACLYHTRRKRYEVTKGYRPEITEPDCARDLPLMQNISSDGAGFYHEILRPERRIATDLAASISRAVFARQSIEINYYSASSGSGGWRRVIPALFVNDGSRIHLRAFCKKTNQYRDFVLGRISDVREPLPLEDPRPEDKEWESIQTLELRQAPGLAENQVKALAMDFDMETGIKIVQTRRALGIYFRRRLGFPDQGTPVVNSTGLLELTARD